MVSYLEWVQNLQSFYWSEDEVNSKMRVIMINAFNDVYNESAKRGVSLRFAAYITAVARIVNVSKLRGK